MQTGTERRHVKTKKQDGPPQAKERDLEQILPSLPSEGTNPANTLISDLQPSRLLLTQTAVLRYGSPSKVIPPYTK